MPYFIVIIFFVALLIALPAILSLLQKQRLKKRALIISQPFPDHWLEIIRSKVPLYNRLPSKLKDELLNHIKVFLAEKRFEGCKGLDITDEIKIMIAAQACFLLLNRKTAYFPRLHTILVYPQTYFSKQSGMFSSLHPEKGTAVQGESWDKGTIVLAWNHVNQGINNIFDGQNVVLHEFAHQLDTENGAADGLPILSDSSKYRPYITQVDSVYQRFLKKVSQGKKDVLNSYGATNPAEFFAVATETFFEKPWQLRKKHPTLYNQFQEFYQLDPFSWSENE